MNKNTVANIDKTLFSSLIDARNTYGRQRLALVDADDTSLTYDRLVLGALVLGSKLARVTERSENVGVLLPNASGAAVTLFALISHGRVPAMLNFTAGIANIRSACKTAQIKTVLTSRRFVKLGELDAVIDALKTRDTADPDFAPVEIVYLEDVRKGIGTLDKLMGLARSKRASGFHKGFGVKPTDPAVILFTSGSEGQPKGVVLSHRNLVANVTQVLTCEAGTHLKRSDVVVNPLPMFHSFGLTGGLLVGLFGGMKIALYPSPLHYKELPKFIRAQKGTIVFATDTFMRGYARAGQPEDFETLRIVVAGAERVKEDTHTTWAKFGTTVVEGYGATECSPVITVNSPSDNRVGEVGRLMPGVEARLEPIEGMDSAAGRLLVRGPNVMLGYMFAHQPGVIVPPKEGWHDTGDIVSIADDGMLRVRGRVKRFAKLGGEMISFAAVEAVVCELWPDNQHVVTSLPDPRKGEQLILVTDHSRAAREPLIEHVRRAGHPELWIPRSIVTVEEIPLLATGKVNFGSVDELARLSVQGARAA